MATVAQAVDGVKAEAGEILEEVQNQISALDFSLDSLTALIEKYGLITREVLGSSYNTLVDQRALPPIDPGTLYDQQRLGLVGITVLGEVFFPTVPTGNLQATQEFYLSVGRDLPLVAEQLDANPPGIPETDTFTNASSRFVVKAISSQTPRGTLKTNDEIAAELGVVSFEVFSFTDFPQLLFVVIPEFISINEPMFSISRRLDLPQRQIVNRVNWFGHVNATSSNFTKMRTTLGLTNPQIRSASFGDDIALSSSNLFKGLLASMQGRFNFVTSTPDLDRLSNILDAVQQEAFEFLAQFTFGVSVLEDREVVNDAREGGVSDNELSFSFENRDDQSYTGADLTANNLRATVFPPTSNAVDRATLGRALQQDPDTLRYTNRSLNQPAELRKATTTAAKRLVASLTARKLILQRENVTPQEAVEALLGVLQDLADLQTAYDEFLTPPEAEPRRPGTRTTESANLTLTRATKLVDTLRIVDQIVNFPPDFQGEVTQDLSQVLSSLGVSARAIQSYLNIYRNGEVRDFLASAVSVSSVTNLILADGQPASSLIVQEIPAAIDSLDDSIQTNILDDPESPNLYSNVSLQVRAFVSVLRGDSEDDPVGRLFELPITVCDALLPSETAPNAFSITLEGDQEEALRQIRESFAVLRDTVPATIRDLGILVSNFGCAFTDAKFFVSRLAGESVGELVTALRQS